jgi:DNA helicase-2/ATP-dependent DNA helicase PcrA
VRAAALDAGWLEQIPEKLGERELVRQTDLARLVSLADGFDGSAGEFVEELRRRFDPGGDGARGVHLLTLHRAKGLEFDTVFLPRLDEKELPSRHARTPAELDEERRLLYVGMTRAKQTLWLTWSGRPSRFLAELGVARAKGSPGDRGTRSTGEWTPVGERLRAWRLERAREDGVPPYVVFHDTVLHAIADAGPASLGELYQIAGVGPAKLERYGGAVLSVLLER